MQWKNHTQSKVPGIQVSQSCGQQIIELALSLDTVKTSLAPLSMEIVGQFLSFDI